MADGGPRIRFSWKSDERRRSAEGRSEDKHPSKKGRRPPSRAAVVAFALALGVLFGLGGVMALVVTGRDLARALVYPNLPLADLPYVQGTVARAYEYRYYSRPRGSRECSWRILLEEPSYELVYPCELPGYRRLERATRTPGTVVEAWHEPFAIPPEDMVRLWQLRVDGQVVVAREQVAEANAARRPQTLLASLLFIPMGLLFLGISLAGFLAVFHEARPRSAPD
jgi:hypothetical protein